MQATVIEDAKVLIPNKEHKNFTASNEVIEAGRTVEGQPREIQGLRRGEPFTYKLFYTNQHQFIHLKKIKPMNTVEVTLGADAENGSGADAGQSPTVVDLPPTKTNSKKKLWGVVIGGALGFAYAKYKAHDLKKSAMFMGVGAAVGYGIGWYLEGRTKIVVKKSK